MGFLTNPNDAEFWVLLAVVVFVIILVRVRVPALVTKALDDAGSKVQAQLDEAQRLRQEAEALLAEVKVQRAETERAAEDMMRSAKSDAERLRAEAAVKLDEDVKRRAGSSRAQDRLGRKPSRQRRQSRRGRYGSAGVGGSPCGDAS